MARKQLARLLFEAAALADRLSEGDSTLAPEELNDLLKEAGHEPDALRGRLHEGARGIAQRLREAGKPVPRHLGEVIETTAPLDVLAARRPRTALEKVRRWLRQLASDAATGAAPSPETVAVRRAYRKTAELSREDARLLDDLESEVKARAATDRKDQDGGEQKK